MTFFSHLQLPIVAALPGVCVCRGIQTVLERKHARANGSSGKAPGELHWLEPEALLGQVLVPILPQGRRICYNRGPSVMGG